MIFRELIYLLILNITSKACNTRARKSQTNLRDSRDGTKRETIIEKCEDAVHEDWKFSETSPVVLCFVLFVHLSFSCTFSPFKDALILFQFLSKLAVCR